MIEELIFISIEFISEDRRFCLRRKRYACSRNNSHKQFFELQYFSQYVHKGSFSKASKECITN